MAEEPIHWRDRLDDGWLVLDRLRTDKRLVAAGVAALVGCVLWAYLSRPAGSETPVEELIPVVALDPTTVPSLASEPVVVHVVGAVVSPGVFELDPSARVIDAIEAAGGVTADADVAQLNLAAPAIDGSQIIVARVGEEVSAPVRAPDGAAPGGVGADGLVDLNGATAAELESLSGVGPATASAIIEWRESSGPFQSVEQLLEVPGIGPAKLAGLQDQVVVR